MAYPMEISRTWKFPWVKPAATHGNFQGLEISMTWKIPGPDTHLPLQNFFDGEYFAMNLFLQRHLLLFIWNFHGEKPRGGLVKDQTLFNIFFGNLPVYILIFASIIFILVWKKNIVWRVYFILLEYNGESRPDKWRNSGMAEKLVIRKVFWIKFGSSQDISLFCWWPKNVCIIEGNGKNQIRENMEKNSHFARDPPLWEHPCQKIKVYFVF